jgi:hypothetical protein
VEAISAEEAINWASFTSEWESWVLPSTDQWKSTIYRMAATRMARTGASATGILSIFLADVPVSQEQARDIRRRAMPSVSKMAGLEHTGLCTNSESSLARAGD